MTAIQNPLGTPVGGTLETISDEKLSTSALPGVGQTGDTHPTKEHVDKFQISSRISPSNDIESSDGHGGLIADHVSAVEPSLAEKVVEQHSPKACLDTVSSQAPLS